MSTTVREQIREAQRVLQGRTATARQVHELADALYTEKELHYAERLYALARRISEDAEGETWLRLRHAYTVYRNTGLRLEQRLERALEIIQEDGCDLVVCQDPGILAMAAQIHLERWRVSADRTELETALGFSLRGWERGRRSLLQAGWSVTVATQVLELSAALDKDTAARARAGSGATAEQGRQLERLAQLAAERHRLADRIRDAFLVAVEATLDGTGGDPDEGAVTDLAQTANLRFWALANAAQAHFALIDRLPQEAGSAAGATMAAIRAEHAAKARSCLEKAFSLPPSLDRYIGELDHQKLAEDLAEIARWRREAAALTRQTGSADEIAEVEATARLRRSILVLFESYAPGLDSARLGKVGLALSGGGFRAAFFHLGVLARLAELDLLRHVEIISGVSGGAIVGAHLYLKVCRLLEDNDAPTAADYARVIDEMAQEFRQGVQRNIRTRIGLNPLKNLAMWWRGSYNATARAGELYEELLFRDAHPSEEAGHVGRLAVRPREWGGLPRRPLDATPQGDLPFRQRHHNWRLSAKVPSLVLNAGSLNTGHNWQFTTAGWMGEPSAGIDPDVDGNERLRTTYFHDAPQRWRRIPLGLAVSASASVPGLFAPASFPGLYPDRHVYLVDGGVYDNQGTAALLQEDCDVMLVSDASGQLDADSFPRTGKLGVIGRATEILQARVRQSQYSALVERRRAGLLRGLMFVHLRAGLDVEIIDPLQTPDPLSGAERYEVKSTEGALTAYGIRKDVQRLLAALRTDLDCFNDTEAAALMYSGYRMAEHQIERHFGHLLPPAREGSRRRWRFLDIEPAMTRPREADRLKPVLAAGRNTLFKSLRLLTSLALSRGPLRRAHRALGAPRGRHLRRLSWGTVKVVLGAPLALGTTLAAGLQVGLLDRLFLELGRLDRVLGETSGEATAAAAAEAERRDR